MCSKCKGCVNCVNLRRRTCSSNRKASREMIQRTPGDKQILDGMSTRCGKSATELQQTTDGRSGWSVLIANALEVQTLSKWFKE